MKYIKSSKGYFYKEYKNGKKVRISKMDYIKLKRKNIIKKKSVKQKGGNGKCEITLIRHEHSGSNAYTILDKHVDDEKRSKLNKLAIKVTGFSKSLNDLVQDPALSHLGIFHAIDNSENYMSRNYNVIVCSNMLRAIQTAILLFPDSKIYVIPYINEIAKSGVERTLTGSHRLPIRKEELLPKIDLTFRIFRENDREVLKSIFHNDDTVIQKLRKHQESYDYFRVCDVIWDIYDEYKKQVRNEEELFMPDMQKVFTEVMGDVLTKTTTEITRPKIACITHGFTIKSQSNPIGWLYYMKNKSNSEHSVMYATPIGEDDFNNNLFFRNSGSYSFSNCASLQFVFNYVKHTFSELQCLFPKNLTDSYSCMYKGIKLEFNKQCRSNNQTSVRLEDYFDSINTMEQIGREISFCKKFLDSDQLKVFKEKFEFINAIPYLEHIQQEIEKMNNNIRRIGNNKINLKKNLKNKLHCIELVIFWLENESNTEFDEKLQAFISGHNLTKYDFTSFLELLTYPFFHPLIWILFSKTTLLDYLKQKVNKKNILSHLYGEHPISKNTNLLNICADDSRDTIIFMLESQIQNDDMFIKIAKLIKPKLFSHANTRKTILNKVNYRVNPSTQNISNEDLLRKVRKALGWSTKTINDH